MPALKIVTSKILLFPLSCCFYSFTILGINFILPSLIWHFIDNRAANLAKIHATLPSSFLLLFIKLNLLHYFSILFVILLQLSIDFIHPVLLQLKNPPLFLLFQFYIYFAFQVPFNFVLDLVKLDFSELFLFG